MRRVGSALQRAGLAERPVKSEDQLRQVVQRVYYPEPYQPLNAPFPHVAFCAIFEQMWCPTGYTRGELITSIALAPGEELTLEMHSWTKENFKSERELAVESEVTLNNRLTARDHLEVISRMATQTSIGSNANASVTIPVKGIPIGVSGGVTSSTALNNALDTTVQRTTESTTETATALRSQRKMRIEVARETGSDERQLRKVANPNRCHTLNVHYYEVISNYDVKVTLTELIPCVLLPVTLDAITEDWVLCHEHILRGGLLSRTFLPGFAAAKTLATQAMLERLEEEAGLPAPSATPAAGPADPLEEEMLNHRGAILAAYNELVGVGEAQQVALASLTDALAEGDFIGAAATVGELMDAFPKLLALGILQMNRTAVSALDGLQAAA
jgi:hypothetical protein